MKDRFNILGIIFSIVSCMLLIYDAGLGIMSSQQHNTTNIFALIVLPFAVILLILSSILFLLILKNKSITAQNIIKNIIGIANFVLGILFVWFTFVKSDKNVFYGIIAFVLITSSILLLKNISKK